MARTEASLSDKFDLDKELVLLTGAQASVRLMLMQHERDKRSGLNTAGYVSGFLRTLPPPGKPRLEGAGAMHAWVRAWAGAEMGWIEFDPTNDRATGVDHIIVGYGRDYDDAAPVRGALRGFGAHESRQAVDVVPLDDPAGG